MYGWTPFLRTTKERAKYCEFHSRILCNVHFTLKHYFIMQQKSINLVKDKNDLAGRNIFTLS